MEKLRNDGEWTEGRYRSFITSTLRGGMRRWPPKWKALKEASVGRKVNPKTNKLAAHFKCASCNGEFTSTNVEIDHIEPVVASTGFVSWDVYIERLFCEVGNLQVLCKPCHKAKTKGENSAPKRVSTKRGEVHATTVVEPGIPVKRASRRNGGSARPVRKSSAGLGGKSKRGKSTKGTR